MFRAPYRSKGMLLMMYEYLRTARRGNVSSNNKNEHFNNGLTSIIPANNKERSFNYVRISFLLFRREKNSCFFLLATLIELHKLTGIRRSNCIRDST